MVFQSSFCLHQCDKRHNFKVFHSAVSISGKTDAATLEQLATGRALMHSIRQMPGSPKSVAEQVAILYAGTNKWLADIATARLPEALKALSSALETTQTGQAYARRVRENPVLDDELKTMLDGLMQDVLSAYNPKRK